ncbi:MAG TPA: TlpA disulfide reductase family protein [Nocardioides sp.]|nr:TlpA disulfide reductase family protein [Nocardioides sp.]
MRRLPGSPLAAALLAAAVLLTGCDQGEPAAACDVAVDTEELRDLKADAAMADCPEGDPDAGTELPDVVLPCLGGGAETALADVPGPAIVNFWASNCGPCVKEMPVLEEFHQEYGDRVPVLGVDFLDTYPGAALDLAQRTGATYPSVADPCGALQETDLVVATLPHFLFVAEDGSVEHVPGGVETLDEVVELAETHLGVELDGKAA